MKAKKSVTRAARELFRFCLVDGALDERRARDVAARLAASPRRGAFGVLLAFQRLVRLDSDRRTAMVQSAVPLAGMLRNRIQAELGRTYGTGLETSFEANPALLGGVRIKVGSDVYDGSVRARLDALLARL